MHYHVIQKSYQSTYNGRTRWITCWNVEVTNDNGLTYTLFFGGRLCLKRGLQKLDQKIKDAAEKRQTEAKAKAATLKKRYHQTWWGLTVDNKTGQVVRSKPRPRLRPKPQPG